MSTYQCLATRLVAWYVNATLKTLPACSSTNVLTLEFSTTWCNAVRKKFFFSWLHTWNDTIFSIQKCVKYFKFNVCSVGQVKGSPFFWGGGGDYMLVHTDEVLTALPLLLHMVTLNWYLAPDNEIQVLSGSDHLIDHIHTFGLISDWENSQNLSLEHIWETLANQGCHFTQRPKLTCKTIWLNIFWIEKYFLEKIT